MENASPLFTCNLHSFSASDSVKGIDSIDTSNFELRYVYNYISKTWQKQTSVEELNKFFKALGSQGIDFSLLNNQTPMIEEEPTIKSNGALEIKSLYNGQPLGLKVNVEIILDYVSEFGEWKLLAIDIHPKQG